MMKIIVKKKLLLTALERCAQASASDKDRVQAHIGYVLLNAKHYDDEQGSQDLLGCYAADVLVSVDTAVELEQLGEPGVAAVETRRLQTMVAHLPGDLVAFNAGDKLLTVSSPKHDRIYRVPIVPESLFPRLIEPSQNDRSLSIIGDPVARAIERVGHAIARNTGQEHLHGILFELEPTDPQEKDKNAKVALNAIAASGHKMAWVRHPVLLEDIDPTGFRFFLPGSLLGLVQKIVSPGEEITIYASDRVTFVETEDTLVSCLVPQTDFIPWRTVFDAVVTKKTGIVGRVALEGAVRAIISVRSKQTSPVTLTSHLDRLHVKLEGDEVEAGDILPFKPAQDGEGNPVPLNVTVDPSYIIDHLHGADSDVSIETSDGPVCFASDDGYRGYAAPIVQQRSWSSPAPAVAEHDGGKDKPDAKRRGGRKKKDSAQTAAGDTK